MKNLSFDKPFNGPFVLCILDGFGDNPNIHGNAIAQAYTPVLDRFNQQYPKCQIRTDGEFVGLPKGQMGNSEVGHINLGAGRIVPQILQKIRDDVNAGVFLEKPNVQKFLAEHKSGQAIHLIGLVSDGGVHSHIDHLMGLIDSLIPKKQKIFIHVITDGRDTAPSDSLNQIKNLEEKIENLPQVSIADVCGRFYAMDRDKKMERTEKAYNLYTKGESETQARSLSQAIAQAYQKDETDEFLSPILITKNSCIQPKDTVIFFNYRSDRMRQIVELFIQSRQENHIATMTQYDERFDDHVVVFYQPEQVKETLGELIATKGGKQLRIAETEKYAHVTFFFNGGREETFSREQRIMVPSPKVRTYDLQPEMSLPELSKQLFSAITDENYDLIICNIANGDMVGHTGNFEASIKAVEAIDVFLSGLEQAILKAKGEVIITADHGNIEEVLDEKGHSVTTHSTHPVPLFYIGRKANLKDGALSDVAPTILSILSLRQPAVMTGRSLITF